MADRGPWYERAVDWAYSLVAPGRAAVRRHLRRMDRDAEYREVTLAVLRARGYRAAESRQGQTPWRSGFAGRSADSEVLGDLPTLRNRSRESGRDDPLASGLLAEFTRQVVGTGLRPQARTGDRDADQLHELVFAQATRNLSPADGLTYGALQRLRFRRLVEDGEVFVVASVNAAGDMVSETVEADRVATPLGTKAAASIRAGVERDATGAVVAYWIADRYPQELVAGATVAGAFGPATYTRVPAERVRHLRLVDRPGQTRGVPLLHAVLQDLRDLDLLLLATLKRSQVAACLAVFLESTSPTSSILDVTAQTYGYVLDQDLEPGMIFRLYPGEKVSQVSPSAEAADLEKFAILLARRIGAALGVSWQTVLKDWSTANYSSARTQILENRVTMAVLRDLFVRELLDWEWRWVLEHEALRGNLALDGSTGVPAADWIADAVEWVDPEKEAQATQIKLSLGLTTMRDEIAAQGRDWEDVLRQRLVEAQRERELRAELEAPTAVAGASAGSADVQGTALNGAQIASLQAMVLAVAAGQLPPEAAVPMILVSFPSVSQEQAEAMVLPAAALAEPAPPAASLAAGPAPLPAPAPAEEVPA